MSDYKESNSTELVCGVLLVVSLLVIFSVAWAVH